MGVIEAHEQKARPDPSPADRAIGRRFEGRVAYVTEAPRASAAPPRSGSRAGEHGPSSPISTALVAGHVARVRDPDAMRRLLESQTPIAGMPAPGDVPAVVAFLACDDARWVTGHTLPIDGGFRAR